MGLRAALLLRILVAWGIGQAIAVGPLVIPWCDRCMIPSGAIVEISLMLALPLLAVGLACCAIWPGSLGRHPAAWVCSTVLVSFLYLLCNDLKPSAFAECWIGAAVAGMVFYLWARYRPLLSIAR